MSTSTENPDSNQNDGRLISLANKFEKIVLVSAGMLIMGMANMIFMLITK